MSTNNIFSRLRKQEQDAIYSFENEHDACGVGLVVTLNGQKSHAIVENGLQVLENMVHRGAERADNVTGDGAGILVQIPHEFILFQGIAVPAEGRYGTGLVFLPQDQEERKFCMTVIEEEAAQEHLSLLYVRDVPVNSDCLGEIARSNEPVIK